MNSIEKGMIKCLQSCIECEEICSCCCKIFCMNGDCVKEMLKACIKACKKCHSICSKHKNKTCQTCAKTCKECILFCEKKLKC